MILTVRNPDGELMLVTPLTTERLFIVVMTASPVAVKLPSVMVTFGGLVAEYPEPPAVIYTPVTLPLAPGQYNLVVRLAGYEAYSDRVQVKDNIQTQLDLDLKEKNNVKIAWAEVATVLLDYRVTLG